jgi:hypothetical protein
MADDWRVRVELPEEHGASFFERLGLQSTAAEELADELRHRRLAATRDEDTVFVYAETAAQAARAREIIAAQLADDGIEPREIGVEQWLAGDSRWSNEQPGPSVEDDLRDRGWAPWEVRVETEGAHEARELADRLRGEGYDVERTWSFVVVGTSTREEAEALARRVHGHVEPGGEMVWEVTPGNPFAIFGGLGG